MKKAVIFVQGGCHPMKLTETAYCIRDGTEAGIQLALDIKIQTFRILLNGTAPSGYTNIINYYHPESFSQNIYLLPPSASLFIYFDQVDMAALSLLPFTSLALWSQQSWDASFLPQTQAACSYQVGDLALRILSVTLQESSLHSYTAGVMRQQNAGMPARPSSSDSALDSDF